MIVGLTGGIGSGKSTIATMFSNFPNNAIYNADMEAKKLMTTSISIKRQLIEQFGELSYIDNQLNKKLIANIVFNNKEKLSLLNTIVHPEVKKHFNNFVDDHQHKSYILYENAILFENNNDSICSKIITVTTPLNIRIERVMKRDKCSKQDVLDRINNQWQEEKKIVLSNYVIDNTTLNNSRKRVDEIHNFLTKKSIVDF